MHGLEILAAVATVGGTWALVFFTWRLVKEQHLLAEGQLAIGKEQLTIQLYLELRKEFDGPLISARKLLSRQLLDSAPHDEINETVLNFFEDIWGCWYVATMLIARWFGTRLAIMPQGGGAR
jgi:hypothetical protein